MALRRARDFRAPAKERSTLCVLLPLNHRPQPNRIQTEKNTRWGFPVKVNKGG